MKQTAKHIIFQGQVQGVGFRFTACNLARRNALAGTVRNLPDGTVEMEVQGDQCDIDRCLEDIAEAFGWRITRIQIQPAALRPGIEDFKIAF